MSSKKKHLKYRAKKEPDKQIVNPLPDLMLNNPVVGKQVGLPRKASPKAALPAASLRAEKPSVVTELSEGDQVIVKRELWHILRVAVGILVLYSVLWYVFHTLHWDQAILKLIPVHNS